jgi:hypothetical protein
VGRGLAGKADLSYIINDEQIEKKRLAQAPESRQKGQGKETSPGQGQIDK